MQCSTTTYNDTFWQKEKLLFQTGGEQKRRRLSVLRVTRPMYGDVWQRGDSSNAPIRKIICRTNYVEKKRKNKLSPLKKKNTANNVYTTLFH